MAHEQKLRGGYAVGRHSRERILRAALLEFSEHGYRGTSLSRIAERTGLSEAGLRHHFPNKDAILIAVLEERDAESQSVAAGSSALQGIEDLENHITIVESNAQAPELARLFTALTAEATTRNHPAAPWASERFRIICDSVAEGLRGGIKSGELRADIDADRLARQIVAVMDGLQLQWLLNPERIDMVEDFRRYTAGLIASIRNTKRGPT